MTALDLFGYVGSILVAISLMMSNIKRLRWINLFGAAVFSCYGFLIDAVPVFLLNGWIVLVDIYYLGRMYRFQDDFDMVKLSSVRTPLFELLIEKYGADMQQFFPDTSLDELDNAVALLIFRNMKPVGVFAYRQNPNHPDSADVLIDYVIAEARDMKTAEFLFNRHKTQLIKEGIHTLVAKKYHTKHTPYLEKIGFVLKNNSYQLALT